MKSALSLAEIRTAFSGELPARAPFPGEQPRASVALILAGEEASPHLAFIRRAEHPGDPWSGHMALPGGRADSTDPDPESVAERETLEEIGISLRREQLIAPLDELPVFRAGTDTGMMLSPFLYQIGARFPKFRANREVAKAYWIPLTHLLQPSHATRLTFDRNGSRWHYPAIRFGDEVIWGLTYRVLAAFFERFGLSLPAPP